jgi:hypothetical protein
MVHLMGLFFLWASASYGLGNRVMFCPHMEGMLYWVKQSLCISRQVRGFPGGRGS